MCHIISIPAVSPTAHAPVASPPQATSASPRAPLDGLDPAAPLQTKKVDRARLANMRGHRYGEILVSNSTQGLDGLRSLTAYNTLMFGCDERKWDDLTEQAVKTQFDSWMVKKNGPRFWTIDTVTEDTTLVDPSSTFIGGMEMVVVGIVKASWFDLIRAFATGAVANYVERAVHRHTTYVFRKDQWVYVLTSPVGKTYVMQSYSTQYNASLTLDALKDLGPTLSLPAGWSFKPIMLQRDLHLRAVDSIGRLVNDNFFNSYSQCDAALLEAAARPADPAPI